MNSIKVNKKILAIIPARGGSKGVQKKNIQDVCGKPLINYTIDTDKDSKELFFRAILSSDDEEIIKICRNQEIEIPFIRPSHISDDKAKMIDVVRHAVEFVENESQTKLDWIMLLQPTEPFRTKEDISKSIELALEGGCDSVISVKQVFSTHPILMKKVTNNFLEPYSIVEVEGTRRQDYNPPAYMRNGAIYLVKRDVIIEQNSLWGNKIRPYIMPEERDGGSFTTETFTASRIHRWSYCSWNN